MLVCLHCWLIVGGVKNVLALQLAMAVLRRNVLVGWLLCFTVCIVQFCGRLLSGSSPLGCAALALK